MKKLLTAKEIEDFKADGAIVLRKKFDVSWVEKLKRGIEKDIKSPSPRFKSHTTKKYSSLFRRLLDMGSCSGV